MRSQLSRKSLTYDQQYLSLYQKTLQSTLNKKINNLYSHLKLKLFIRVISKNYSLMEWNPFKKNLAALQADQKDDQVMSFLLRQVRLKKVDFLLEKSTWVTIFFNQICMILKIKNPPKKYQAWAFSKIHNTKGRTITSLHKRYKLQL